MGFTVQYYDLVLFGVLASVATGVGIGLFTPVDLTTSVPALAVVAIALIGHGLFVNGPVDDAGDLTDEVETLN